MTRTLAIAALAAAALAAQAAILHVAVAAPLSNALGNLAAQARPATYTETIVVSPPRPAHANGHKA
jgi:ABC-type molybdate transport system substrate-binding protein